MSRVRRAKRLGVPKALGLSVEQWVNDRLGGYVKMSVAERREVVKQLAADGYSSRNIEDVLGVDHATAARDVAKATGKGKNQKKNNDTIDSDVANATPVDAVATLAATDKVQQAAKLAESRKARVL